MTKAEEQDFERLVRDHSRLVYRVAFALLRNQQDAEDACQETFFKLHRNGTWKDLSNEKAFLARTAWRIALDRIPKHASSTLEADVPSLAPSPEQEAMDSDWKRHIHTLIDSLPEELRQPLALSTIEELRSPEIALIMNIPEGTVRTRIARAKQMLLRKLNPAKEERYAN